MSTAPQVPSAASPSTTTTSPTATAIPTGVASQLFSNQPPPAIVAHTYTFPPTLEQYNKPLNEIILANAPRDTIGVGAYVFKGDSGSPDRQLLLIRRSANETAFPEMYEVPGGGAEAPPIDATLLDSVARELFEETGLVAKNIVRLIDHVDFEGRRGDKWRKFNFEIEVESAAEVVLQPAEHDEFMWVTFMEFKQQMEIGEEGWLWKTMPAQKGTIQIAFETAAA
ncbi:hypothetical protein H072_3289 [Dactylellina haptotyla CBS 200.50]|uniref:Nudix hydrolase domain-containing protein n=1 Tax=Dactylellina haptotyla (strain CBS 200.50) TaxID=1284197 RepID=S8ANI3_DACHA|nr:hypothetical protein H072_3289 [Dactylellina haptotyla CBS 200.50]